MLSRSDNNSVIRYFHTFLPQGKQAAAKLRLLLAKEQLSLSQDTGMLSHFCVLAIVHIQSLFRHDYTMPLFFHFDLSQSQSGLACVDVLCGCLCTAREHHGLVLVIMPGATRPGCSLPHDLASGRATLGRCGT